ncbi:MAG: glycosyltransferase family 2 protein [Eubacteriales bacterium]|nr:glycosyltransferase family 2 protein [Eubacteriales bacterium]
MPHIDDSVCAVVPVYNAKATLSELVNRLERALCAFSAYSVVLVDDGSADGSRELIGELCAKSAHVTGILLRGNFGQQSALLCGLRHAQGNCVAIIDDDLEQAPEDILTLYRLLRTGYDAVYGTPQSSGKGAFRGLGSRLRDRLFDRITDKPKNVRVCSFRILTRDLKEKVIRADTRFVYISLEMLRHTKNVKSVEVSYAPSPRSGYRAARLMALLAKMYVYYAPKTLWKCLRRRGACYEIERVIQGGGA